MQFRHLIFNNRRQCLQWHPIGIFIFWQGYSSWMLGETGFLYKSVPVGFICKSCKEDLQASWFSITFNHNEEDICYFASCTLSLCITWLVSPCQHSASTHARQFYEKHLHGCQVYIKRNHGDGFLRAYFSNAAQSQAQEFKRQTAG